MSPLHSTTPFASSAERQAAAAVKEGIGGAFTVAPTLGANGPAVLESARRAFVDGWQLSLWIAAATAVAAAAFTGVWISRHLRNELTIADELFAGTRSPEVALQAML